MVHSKVLGIINGIVGDYLVKRDNALAITMDFYYNQQKLNGDIKPVELDYPDCKGNASIFLHGSADSEDRWVQKEQVQYGNEIYDAFKSLPLYLRYNSGLHISENGKLLAKLLDQYLSKKNIKKVTIIGHSMGGLIFRSACYYAELHQLDWLKKINATFYLGSPHQGAPLEKFGAWTQSILDKIELPYTKAVSKLINIRSDGIKDLRHGYLIDEEWLSDQKDDFPQNRKIPFPIADKKNSYVVASTIHKNTDALISHWFGDIMVRKDSALGKSKKSHHALDFPIENTLLLGGVVHLNLATNSDVNAFILEKLAQYLTAIPKA